MAQTNINDFHIISKIGTLHLVIITWSYLGSGAFSEVFKVSRKSDGKEYALKKV
jgi:serine/threonine protein kinase